MSIHFTAEEISKVAKRLKNNKSAGPDKLEAEFIKYAPAEVHKEIASIFNKLSETGAEVQELILGLLKPLPKPRKPKGSPENIKPIILLSVLRKILTICFLDRIWNRLKQKIPSKQAAYQPGRGTTEQVHAIKLLTEKAITSNDYNIYLTLLDMSKAFDTVDHKILFEHLEEILNADELFIVHVLTNKPEIAVKIGSLTGISFLTTIGIMQGDCMCLRLPIKTKMKDSLSTQCMLMISLLLAPTKYKYSK